jgi:hypothetical protein
MPALVAAARVCEACEVERRSTYRDVRQQFIVWALLHKLLEDNAGKPECRKSERKRRDNVY